MRAGQKHKKSIVCSQRSEYLQLISEDPVPILRVEQAGQKTGDLILLHLFELWHLSTCTHMFHAQTTTRLRSVSKVTMSSSGLLLFCLMAELPREAAEAMGTLKPPMMTRRMRMMSTTTAKRTKFGSAERYGCGH